MSETSDDEWFTVAVDGKKIWHTDGYGEEYDAIHAAAGALLAGADDVSIKRRTEDDIEAATEGGDGGD